MRTLRSVLYLGALVTLAIMLGCGDSETARAARKEAEEAVRATKEHLAAEKARFIANYEEEIAALERVLDELRGEVNRATEEARRDLPQRIAELEAKKQAALEKLESLKQAGLEQWNNFKEGANRTLEEFRKAFEK
ncbi:MAG: hypothetical protein AB1486_04925 [Planctomycetota bacterium]